MAHTVELLTLIEEYPDAFLEPTDAPLSASVQAKSEESENSDLMSLIAEFPEAFTEPELPTAAKETTETSDDQAAVASVADQSEEEPISTVETKTLEPPKGYEFALHQNVTTFGWGKVSFYFRYGDEGLTSVWMTVGKSGTEVQSFCEAIARLTNRLLAVGTPTVELVKELRGIRGGDSEGLGPHRFLGLVDLLGKALKEAPAKLETQVAVATPSSAPEMITEAPAPVQETIQEVATIQETQETVEAATTEHQWLELSDISESASICPDCGAELQQVNGCSGGACVVCGYSSCS